jgi:hypothetical protein
MTTTSRVPQVIDYLVILFQAAAALGQATPPVNVIDGPKVTADPGPLALWVGVDDIDAVAAGALPAAAASTQQWMGGLGRGNRTEAVEVHCTAQAWSGSDDVRALRVAVAGIVSAVEDVLRGDPGLGGMTPGVKDAAVTGCDWRQGPTGRGMAARAVFTIAVTAIIGAP